MPVYHFDTYRLKDDDEFLNLGPEEYFDSAGITFVEWADRVAALLPQDHLEITIDTNERNRAPHHPPRHIATNGNTSRPHHTACVYP